MSLTTQSTSSIAPGLKNSVRRQTPLIIWGLIFGLLVNFVPIRLRFFDEIAFLGWALPLTISSIYLLSRLHTMRFPWIIWLPWVLWVLIYLISASADHALQRSVMLLCPFVIGCAFSALSVSDGLLIQADLWLKRFLWVMLAGVLLSSGLSFLGLGRWQYAAGSMTVSMMATWIITRYSLGNQKSDLQRWLVLAMVPVVFTTRMGMLATACTLPFTLAPLGLRKRLITLGIISLAGFFVFQTETVQQKMFYSGQGTVTQAFEAGIAMISGESVIGTGFKDHSRSGMRILLQSGIERNYWFGNGANATESILVRMFRLAHPHNDWLRLQYDYGTLGMWLFAVTLAAQCLHAFFAARRLHGLSAVFMYAGASAFIPMVLYMFTDNIILYVSWFGNLQFAMLGLGYAALGHQRIDARSLTPLPVQP